MVQAATTFSIIYEQEMGDGSYHKLVQLVAHRTAECSFTTEVDGAPVTMVDDDYSKALYIEQGEFTNLLRINAWLMFLLVMENTCYPLSRRMINIMAAVDGEPAGKEAK